MKKIRDMINKQSRQSRKQAGFSLVEIMVGLVIGLIGTIVIFQVFAVSEGQKRTTTAGDSASQNGIFATYILEKHFRMGGGGIVNADNALGCPIAASFNSLSVLPAAALPAPFNTLSGVVSAAPLLIRDGGGVNPDTIITMYGNSPTAGIPIKISQSYGTQISVSNTVEMNQGDIILASLQKNLKTDAPQPCFIAQITSLNTLTKIAQIQAAAGNYNSAAGIPPACPDCYEGINLGQGGLLGFAINNPVPERFELVSYDFLTGGPVAPIADNIVNLQALYGVDDGSIGSAEDGIIDAWVPPTGTWSYALLNNGSAASATKLRRIKAVRLALVARSALPEKRDSSGNPVSPANWSLFTDGTPGNPREVSGVLALPQRDYRYKIFETVISLRNPQIQQCSAVDRVGGFCNYIP